MFDGGGGPTMEVPVGGPDRLPCVGGPPVVRSEATRKGVSIRAEKRFTVRAMNIVLPQLGESFCDSLRSSHARCLHSPPPIPPAPP